MKFCLTAFLICLQCYCFAVDIRISGTVKDVQGNSLQSVSISFNSGNDAYKAISDFDGSYEILIPQTGIDQSTIDVYANMPNPFSDRTFIAVNAHSDGQLLFDVYTIMGQKVWETSQHVPWGFFYLEWNGTNQNGNQVTPGIYIYSITFKGKRHSGKMIKVDYPTQMMSPDNLPGVSALDGNQKNSVLLNDNRFFAQVSLYGYNKINHLPVTFHQDTVINFTLSPFRELPFKTSGAYITAWDELSLTYDSVFLKGINLGTSPPGFFPGEIGYAIQADQYERWINRMGSMGFNALRIYTLHPPVFYEKLAQYNESHPGKPLYLFQGIWLDEDTSVSNHDLYRFTKDFDINIEEVISCMHGSLSIPERSGRASGNFTADISQWIMGYIIGREIGPKEVRHTNTSHAADISYSGSSVSLANATPAETWLTARLDKVLTFEKEKFQQERPVSISSWPTLDPLKHSTEPQNTDEDSYALDFATLDLQNAPGGYFASFHAYPYFPNFINEDPGYQKFDDANGPNSYLGYLTDLKKHYANIPLVIAEFGVPSSWGSAHQSFSGMHHGGHTEEKQGAYDVRMLKNIKDAYCAGGMIFAWMDEWWKPTWIVDLLESKSFVDDGKSIPTIQLWLNVCSPEQNFGLIAFDAAEPPDTATYQCDDANGFVSKIEASHDDHFFHVKISLKQDLLSGDTVWIAFDTYRQNLGESVLPGGVKINNRSEFALQIPVAADTASYFVTQAYDEFGLTNTFNDADTLKQLFHSSRTDGDPWNLMRWKNSSHPDAIQNIGKLPMKKANTGIVTNLHAVFIESRSINIRIPWTMLYFSDPTSSEVVNGFISFNEGWGHIPIRAISDGIALSVSSGKNVVNTTNRYSWVKWRQLLNIHTEREKACIPVIEKALKEMDAVRRDE